MGLLPHAGRSSRSQRHRAELEALRLLPPAGSWGNQAKTGQDCDNLQACWPRRGPRGASECDLAREVQAGCPEDVRAESNRMEGRALSRGWEECSWEAEALEWGVEA